MRAVGDFSIFYKIEKIRQNFKNLKILDNFSSESFFFFFNIKNLKGGNFKVLKSFKRLSPQ